MCGCERPCPHDCSCPCHVNGAGKRPVPMTIPNPTLSDEEIALVDAALKLIRSENGMPPLPWTMAGEFPTCEINTERGFRNASVIATVMNAAPRLLATIAELKRQRNEALAKVEVLDESRQHHQWCADCAESCGSCPTCAALDARMYFTTPPTEPTEEQA